MTWQCNYCGWSNEDQADDFCDNCEKPREYSGPEDIDYNAPDTAERAEMQDRARRIR